MNYLTSSKKFFVILSILCCVMLIYAKECTVTDAKCAVKYHYTCFISLVCCIFATTNRNLSLKSLICKGIKKK